MRSIVLIGIFLMALLKVFGQQVNPTGLSNHVLEFRQVSGIVQDSTGVGIGGASVKLISAMDSIKVIADKDGIFVIDKVKMANFVLTTSATGFANKVGRYKNNDFNPKIVLSPIVLIDESNMLKTVIVNSIVPSIIYKNDTVEYRASDYKVPEYSSVDELLKRMEGMEVGRDGSLVYQGQPVTKAKLNGRTFNGGNIAQTIQNLPASIVDKVQIIDDYGDQAARTGIKDGDPSKTLNIITRADKSIGTMATIVSQEGNHDRYNEQLSVQNINANRTISLIGNVSKTVNGIASSSSTSTTSNTSTGSSSTGQSSTSLPGTTLSGSPTFSYNDNWGSKIIATGSYTYNFNKTNSLVNKYGQINSNIGPSNFNDTSSSTNNSKGHNIKFELDYNVGKFDYVQINPTFSYNNSSVNSNSAGNNINYFTTGLEHNIVNMLNSNPTINYNYGLTAMYVHSFKKPRRNFSIQLGYSKSMNKINGDVSADYRYFGDTTEDILVKDSLSHLLTRRYSNNSTYRSIITYVEPINTKSQLEFTGQFKNSLYDNNATSDTVLANGQLEELTRLSNIYNFSFIETRLSIDYRYGDNKTGYSLGASIVPTTISGNQIDNNTNNSVSTSRSDFRVIPVFRYYYNWSNVERFQITYSGTNIEPNFRQMQPFTDRSDPNNIIVGNPNLRPTFIHNIAASYNKYFPNNKFNVSFNVSGKLYDNQVTTNIVQVTVPISDTLNKTINEINYINLNGDKYIISNYSISKQLNNRNYNLTLNGRITYGYTNAMSDNLEYKTVVWDFNERFGPRITLNDSKFMINPYISYEVNKSATNTLNSTSSTIRTTKFAIDGQIYFRHNFQLHYDASKNYISGFENYNLNPLVINAGFEKRLLRRHNLVLTFDVFDLLHQNSFVQQSITPQSTTYTLSNTQSRYFLVGLKLNLQKWGGTPERNGKPMQRWGDGSFH